MIYIVLYLCICSFLFLIVGKVSSIDYLEENSGKLVFAILFWPLTLLVLTILGLSFIIGIIIYSNRY